MTTTTDRLRAASVIGCRLGTGTNEEKSHLVAGFQLSIDGLLHLIIFSYMSMGLEANRHPTTNAASELGISSLSLRAFSPFFHVASKHPRPRSMPSSTSSPSSEQAVSLVTPSPSLPPSLFLPARLCKSNSSLVFPSWSILVKVYYINCSFDTNAQILIFDTIFYVTLY